MDQEDKAMRVLEQAWAAGARGSGTAIRLSRMYDERSRSAEAHTVLREALTRIPDDKPAHHAMAMHLMDTDPLDFGLIEDHLQRSFSTDDRNFEYRFNLAQLYFLRGQIEYCQDLFTEINQNAPEDFRRMIPRTDDVFTKRLKRYLGTISGIKASFIFLQSAAYLTDIFGHRNMLIADIFDDLSFGDLVNFQI